MSDSTAGLLQATVLVAALALVHRPLSDYIARVVTGQRHSRVERGIYRLVGVDGDAEQSWSGYLRGVLAFSAVGVVFLYAFQRLQNQLWLGLGLPAVEPGQAWNTAVSFVTNTNWQSYSGESTMGHLAAMPTGSSCGWSTGVPGCRWGIGSGSSPRSNGWATPTTRPGSDWDWHSAGG